VFVSAICSSEQFVTLNSANSVSLNAPFIFARNGGLFFLAKVLAQYIFLSFLSTLERKREKINRARS